MSQVSSIPGVALLPLRVFLGVTFIYGGLQKLSDPGFFKAGSPTYIGAQIISYGRGSPIRPILMHAAEHATLAGALTIATELTIGILVLAGLFTRLASIVGMALNLTFFLSASWHTYPYFMGSDIVFVMAWLTLALAGPGAYALDFAVAPVLSSLFQPERPDHARQAMVPVGLAHPGPRSHGRRLGRGGRQRCSRRSFQNSSNGDSGRPGFRGGKANTQSPRSSGGLWAAVGLVILGLLPRPSLSGVRAAGPSPSGSGSSTTGSGSSTLPIGAKKVGTLNQLKTSQALIPNDPSVETRRLS